MVTHRQSRMLFLTLEKLRMQQDDGG